MDRKTLRSLTWPRLQQPIPKEEIAKAISIDLHLPYDEVMSVINELHNDIGKMVEHINSVMSGKPPPNGQLPDIAPIDAAALKAMWQWANFVLSKGG